MKIQFCFGDGRNRANDALFVALWSCLVLGLWEDVKLLLDLAKEFKGLFFDT